MALDKCPACGETFFFPNAILHHNCPPRWQVCLDEEDIDDASYHFGVAAQPVAEKCALHWWYENGGAGLEHQTVYVRKVGEEQIAKFEITIEFHPYASVTNIEIIEPKTAPNELEATQCPA